MNDGPLSFALRELRAQVTHPVTLVILAGVVALMVMLGPFGTQDRFGVGLRSVYWAVLVCSTYVLGSLASLVATHRASGLLGRILIAGVLTGLGACAVVFLVNAVFLGFVPRGFGIAIMVGQIFGIALIVTIIVQIVFAEVNKPLNMAEHKETRVPLLDRLPLNVRGPLVAVSVEDHYVRIRTTKGEEMVLMRLADAIKETGATKGTQVHRSHWIAFDKVVAVRREGDRAILTMHVGPDVPVSRANVPKLKEAGLLP